MTQYQRAKLINLLLLNKQHLYMIFLKFKVIGLPGYVLFFPPGIKFLSDSSVIGPESQLFCLGLAVFINVIDAIN